LKKEKAMSKDDTDEAEIRRRIYSDLVPAFADLYEELSGIEDLEERRRKFEAGVQSLIVAHQQAFLGPASAWQEN
jgi:hypothetical protein